MDCAAESPSVSVHPGNLPITRGTRLPFEGGLIPGIDSMQGMRGKMSVSVKGADVTWLGGELSLESDTPALESQLYTPIKPDEYNSGNQLDPSQRLRWGR